MDISLVVVVAVAGGIWLGMMGIAARVYLRKKELETQGGSAELALQVDELREELGQLRTAQEMQVSELFERLEFTERMLTNGRAPDDADRASTPV